MNVLTNVLYWVSTAMLVPVIIVILGMFLYSLVLVGSFLGLYMNRLGFKKNIAAVLDKLHSGQTMQLSDIKALEANRLFHEHLSKFIKNPKNPAFIDKTVTDFELACEKQLEGGKSIMRLGPMVGLMGTLIPMGPALVGLAQGNIASMATNMQVAFSTTVVGIFIGGIGFVVQLIKQRWFIEDISNFEYIAGTQKEAANEKA